MAGPDQSASPRAGTREDVRPARYPISRLLLGVPSMNPRKDLSAKLGLLQERLGSARGKQYWRTMEELADSEAFQELLRQEFPDQAPLWPESLSRRRFLTLMGASLALAGLGGCSVRPAPTRTLVPHVQAPE